MNVHEMHVTASRCTFCRVDHGGCEEQAGWGVCAPRALARQGTAKMGIKTRR